MVLPNATETMRRYPQFAAGLPFQFGSLYVPVVGGSTTYGVLTVLRPAVTDAAEVLSEHDRVVRLAQELGAALRGLEDAHPDQVAWDGEPVCLRPPTASTSLGRAGRFAWDPETADITLDEDLHTLLGMPPSEFPGTVEAFAEAVAPTDAHRILATLRDTAAGRPPALPLYLRAEDGALRLLDLWNAYEPPAAPAVRGVVVAPGPGPTADSAADLLPDGVFCVDRLGLVVYANPRAAQLLGRPAPSWSAATCGSPCPGCAAPTSRTTCGRRCSHRTRSTSISYARPRRSPRHGRLLRAPDHRCPLGTPGHRCTRGTPGHRHPPRTPGHHHPRGTPGHHAPPRTPGHHSPPRTPGHHRPPGTPGHRRRPRTPAPPNGRTEATGSRCPCTPVRTG